MENLSKSERRSIIGVMLRQAAGSCCLGPTAIAGAMEAHGVGVSPQAVSNYLSGVRGLDGPTLTALAAVLGMDRADTRTIAKLAGLYVEVQ
jgi:hypothetical protein